MLLWPACLTRREGGFDHSQQAMAQCLQGLRADLVGERSIDAAEGSGGGVDCLATPRCERDQLGSAILGIWPRSQVPPLHEVADEFGHGLFRDAGAFRQIGQPNAVVGDVGHDVVVDGAVVHEAGGDEVLLQRVHHVALGQHQEEKEVRPLVGVGHSRKYSKGP